jgi:hypothetical protein
MTVKITPRLNTLVKIVAIIQLLLLIFDSISGISHYTYSRSHYTVIFMAIGLLAVFMPLYVAAVLNFFDEKAFIIIAFLSYAFIEFIAVLNSLAFTLAPGRSSMYISSLSGLLALFSLFYVFIASFFVRNKQLLFPIIFFACVIVVVPMIKLLITLFLPYLADHLALTNWFILQRKIIHYVSILSILAPVAIIVLTDRVNRLITDGQALETPWT